MAGARDPFDRDRDVADHLRLRQNKPLLRFISCGSVDDGKSTLIGRLLWESRALHRDQLDALAAVSRKYGTQGSELDLALLLDGLMAEREQGITIDVAYRFFSTAPRDFIVADTPGHEQFTRNMATAASTASAAVVLVDARKGVVSQTRRHTYVATLLGIRHVVLAVNKMDMVAFSRDIFDRIARDYRAFAATLGLQDVTCIPLSALKGDNVTAPSNATPWFSGPTLIGYLQNVAPDDPARVAAGPLRMVVQWVNRPGPDFRGFCGRILGGSVRQGDRIRVLPSGSESTVARIVTYDGDLAAAIAGQSVTVTLDDEIGISRGDVLCSRDAAAAIADQFKATLIWMHEEEMLPGRSYLLKMGAKTTGVTISALDYCVNTDTHEHMAATSLHLNEIGVCKLSLDESVAFDPYAENRDMGSFIVIDRLTHNTIGAGLLHYALRRSENIHWQAIAVDRHAHAALKRQNPCIVWFTGLSSAGKSTIADRLQQRLHARGLHTFLLDGDNVRHGLNRDLGFTEADRVENIRRIAEVARLMVEAGLIVLVAAISPFRAERRMARSLVGENEFCEVFVDVPLAVAEERDAKGLYRKARRGELHNFTGVDSPYERPERAEVTVDTTVLTAHEAAEAVLGRLNHMNVLTGSDWPPTGH